jgi:hypothetical protein
VQADSHDVSPLVLFRGKHMGFAFDFDFVLVIHKDVPYKTVFS